MSKRRLRTISTFLLVLTDAGMTALAFYLGYRIRLATETQPDSNIPDFSVYTGMMLIQIAAMLTVFFFTKLYHVKRVSSRVDEFYSVFGAVSVGSLFSIAVTSFIYKGALDFPRLMLVYAWILTIVLVMVGRVLHSTARRFLRRSGVGCDRVLIVGTGDVGQLLLQKVRHAPHLGYEPVGFVDGNGLHQGEVMGLPILGTVSELSAIIDRYEVDEVMIALPEAPREKLLEIISRCDRSRIGIKVFPDVFQIIASELSIGDLDGLPMLTVRDVALRGWKLTLKRAFDLVVGSICLIIASPWMLLIALAVKLDSPGPALFVQERMGLDARPFPVIKFRTMRTDAEAETGPVWAKAGDPRCTRLGAFLRHYSLDELPQLINVVLGEMSLVGPRPERPVFVEQFRQRIPRYMDRHREKAGLTGWAQVNGLRGDTSIEERTKYDLWYVENWSLLLDIKILIRTLFRVLRDPNAY
ncbi:MAG: undecaprenyl-phosphate glucose phosphotransferase [Anaerolineae bacterium]|jgi:exopolysaccharide biosynthesis polyprenyl glycosylphosphotransferase